MTGLIMEFINNILIAILGAVGVYIFQCIRKYSRKKKIVRILSLKKSNSGLFIPVRNREIKTSTTGVYEGTTVYNEDLVIYNEALILYEIKKAIDEIRDNSTLELYKNRNSFNMDNNAFYFGGYEAHEYVRDVFCDVFPTVKFTCLEESYNKWKDSKVKRILEITEDTNKRHIKVNGTTVLEYDISKGEGYIVLIKRTGKTDFGSSGYGTEHICFGRNATTTYNLAKSFREHRNALYKHLRRHK